MNFETNNHHATHEDTQRAIDVNTRPLVEQYETPGIGDKGRRELARRIGEVTTIVAQNPERVFVDTLNREPARKTIHDPNKARMVAEVVKEDMDYIAKHDQKSRIFKRMTQRKRERAMINSRYWGQFAEQAYDKDPLGTGSYSIREIRRSNKKAAFKGR